MCLSQYSTTPVLFISFKRRCRIWGFTGSVNIGDGLQGWPEDHHLLVFFYKIFYVFNKWTSRSLRYTKSQIIYFENMCSLLAYIFSLLLSFVSENQHYILHSPLCRYEPRSRLLTVICRTIWYGMCGLDSLQDGWNLFVRFILKEMKIGG